MSSSWEELRKILSRHPFKVALLIAYTRIVQSDSRSLCLVCRKLPWVERHERACRSATDRSNQLLSWPLCVHVATPSAAAGYIPNMSRKRFHWSLLLGLLGHSVYRICWLHVTVHHTSSFPARRGGPALPVSHRVDETWPQLASLLHPATYLPCFLSGN